MTTTGIRLRKCREYLKISQEDIAKLIGSTPSYISLVENDKSKLSVENLVKLLLRYNI
ncbi:helix-turn-helix transcriptional regulator, partial [bacterium]|nr:helix-turn-helix transcriptional regulator [bacterium]